MTELLIDDYSAWLTARKYKAGTLREHCIRVLSRTASFCGELGGM